VDRLTVTTNIDIKAGNQALLPPKPFVLSDVAPDGAPAPLFAIPGNGQKTIEIAPNPPGSGGTAGAWVVSFLLISSDTYDPLITYSVEGKPIPNPASGPAASAPAGAKAAAPAAGERWFSLEYPHLFLGEGAVKLLSADSVDKDHLFEPNSFTFKNGTGNLISVSIYIGRTWVSTPPPKSP
jgi:hypothetical protein